MPSPFSPHPVRRPVPLAVLCRALAGCSAMAPATPRPRDALPPASALPQAAAGSGLRADDTLAIDRWWLHFDDAGLERLLETLRLHRLEQSAGAGSEFDRGRAEAELASTDATLTDLQRQRHALQSALALLAGVPAEAIAALAISAPPLDSWPRSALWKRTARRPCRTWSGPSASAIPALYSAEVLETRRNAATAATAKLALAQAQRRETEVKIAHTRVLAPAGGVITRRGATHAHRDRRAPRAAWWR